MNIRDLRQGEFVMCERPHFSLEQYRLQLCKVKRYGRTVRGVRFVTLIPFTDGRPWKMVFTCSPTRCRLATAEELAANGPLGANVSSDLLMAENGPLSDTEQEWLYDRVKADPEVLNLIRRLVRSGIIDPQDAALLEGYSQ